MDGIINFFVLRPTFTFFGIRVVWYLYLLNILIQSYVSILGVSQVLAQRGVNVDLWSPNFIPFLLGQVVQVAIVRLLLEVAAIIISSSPSSSRR